jgi:DNA-binding XRE family transcriptional regulator
MPSIDLDIAMTSREKHIVRCNLKRLRREKRVSVKALALRNISHQTLLDMESGKVALPIRLAFQLANRLGAKRQELFKPLSQPPHRP